MSDEIHPAVAAIMGQTERLKSVLDTQVARMGAGSFSAADETGTVEVTLNGRHWLTDVHLEEGVLRAGAEVVQQRLTEALAKAGAAASTAGEIDRERLAVELNDIAAQFGTIADTFPFSPGVPGS